MPLPAEFASAVDSCREPDWVLLGIIADWLEDHGDEDAEGLRLAVTFRRWPWKFDAQPVVYWFSGAFECSGHDNLPEKLADKWSKLGVYKTLSAAFLDLSRMIRLARADGYDAWKWEPNTKEMTC